jgi:glutathione S-transferase
MLTVHHLGISQSDRIAWLCEELGIPYTLRRYDRDPVTRLAPPEYRALHPAGTAPVITDGDLVLAESGAIIAYLMAKHGGGSLAVGPDEPDFPDYLFWFHYANASMMTGRMGALIAGATPDGVRDLPIFQMLQDRSDRSFAIVERRLGEAPYFAGGRFTAADLIMVFPLTTMRLFAPMDISGLPNLLAYLQRIGARPAFQRAMAKADPDLPPMLT